MTKKTKRVEGMMKAELTEFGGTARMMEEMRQILAEQPRLRSYDDLMSRLTGGKGSDDEKGTSQAVERPRTARERR